MPYITTERVKEIRQQIRKEFPDFKISVRREHYSVVYITVQSGPIDMTGIDQQPNTFYLESHYPKHPALPLLTRLVEIANRGNEIESVDGDYGNIPSFYLRLHIGEWNKPYEKTEKKVTPVAPKAPAAVSTADVEDIQIVDYSDKSFALIGEGTKKVKDTLMELRGGYNRRLKCGPGWIFPKSKLDLVKNTLHLQ